MFVIGGKFDVCPETEKYAFAAYHTLIRHLSGMIRTDIGAVTDIPFPRGPEGGDAQTLMVEPGKRSQERGADFAFGDLRIAAD